MLDFFDFLKTSPHIGYLIVFLGSMIEGETIVLGASALAAVGYLSISTVALMAFSSTLLVDQIFFFVGHHIYRKPGQPISERFPKLYRKSKRAVILLKKYDIWFILMFRFVYGIRAISPVVIGLCGITPARFIPVNFISAVLWAGVSCGVGYWLGDFLFDTETGVVMSGNMHRLQYGILAFIVVMILGIASSRLIAKWRKRRKLRLPGIDIDQTKTVEKNFYKSIGKKFSSK